MNTSNQETIIDYIKANPLAVLSTVGDKHLPQAATIYTCTIDSKSPFRVYFVTKNGTAKYQNLMDRPHVALTYYNEKQASTLQAEGVASKVRDPHTLSMVMDTITTLHTSNREILPPIAKLQAGNYEVVAITLSTARLANYGAGVHLADKDIFMTWDDSPA